MAASVEVNGFNSYTKWKWKWNIAADILTQTQVQVNATNDGSVSLIVPVNSVHDCSDWKWVIVMQSSLVLI